MCIRDSGLEILGCEEAYCNEDNLFYQAFLEGLKYMNETVPGIRITVDTDIPYARGLGSSATCIVAGLAGANALFQNRMNRYELFDLATRMEGHPDNIAPVSYTHLPGYLHTSCNSCMGRFAKEGAAAPWQRTIFL